MCTIREEASDHKLLIMMVTAAFGFSLLLFQIGTSEINAQNNTIDNIHQDIKEIDNDVTTVKSDVAYIKGKLDQYWPDKKLTTSP